MDGEISIFGPWSPIRPQTAEVNHDSLVFASCTQSQVSKTYHVHALAKDQHVVWIHGPRMNMVADFGHTSINDFGETVTKPILFAPLGLQEESLLWRWIL